MRKWSKQGFLNPASSNDDGWWKFSIRPKKNRHTLGLGIQYIIADCSNKAYLEMEPDYASIDETDGGMRHPNEYPSILESIKERRKKITNFAAAVALSAEKINEALDSYEQELKKAFDIAQARE